MTQAQIVADIALILLFLISTIAVILFIYTDIREERKFQKYNKPLQQEYPLQLGKSEVSSISDGTSARPLRFVTVGRLTFSNYEYLNSHWNTE
jgi:hypothetical protein